MHGVEGASTVHPPTCCPLGSRAAPSRCIHARRARVWGPGATRTAAAQQELHSERQPASSCSAPQKPHALAGPRRPAFPVPSHGLCRAGLGAALGSRSVLPSTAHRSHKTSRGTPHLRRNCPRAAPCPNIAPGRMYVTGLSSHARVHTGVSLMPWQLSSTTKVERDAACTSRGAIAGRKLGVSVHRPTALLLPGTEAGIWDFCGV